MDRPDNYEAIQKSYSVGSSIAIERGACAAVDKTASLLKAHDLECDHILVMGPQNGYELEAWRNAGARTVLGVDCCNDFVETCRSKGFSCFHEEFENLASLNLPPCNFYARQSLEHCYDLVRVAEYITSNIRQWVYFSVPIEGRKHFKDDELKYVLNNKAHYSPFRSEYQVLSLFPGLDLVWHHFKWSTETIGNQDASAIFAKQS